MTFFFFDGQSWMDRLRNMTWFSEPAVMQPEVRGLEHSEYGYFPRETEIDGITDREVIEIGLMRHNRSPDHGPPLTNPRPL